MKMISVMILALLVLVGCATTPAIKSVPPKATFSIADTQRLTDIQLEVNGLYSQGSAYVKANPIKQARWNALQPVFISINNNLVIDRAYPYPLPDVVYYGYQKRLSKIRVYLTNLGVTL